MNKHLKIIAIACGVVFAGMGVYTYGVRRTATYTHTELFNNSTSHINITQQNDEQTNTNCSLFHYYNAFTNKVFRDSLDFDKMGWQVRPSETMDAVNFQYTTTCDCDISVKGKEFETKHMELAGTIQFNRPYDAGNIDTEDACSSMCKLMCNEYYNAVRRDTEFTAPRPQVVTAAKNIMYNILAVNPDIANLTVVE